MRSCIWILAQYIKFLCKGYYPPLDQEINSSRLDLGRHLFCQNYNTATVYVVIFVGFVWKFELPIAIIC